MSRFPTHAPFSARTATCILLLLGIAQTAWAALPTYSIPEFVAAEEKWDELVDKAITIEGRYSFFSPNALRFQKCDVSFLLPRNAVRPLGRSKTVQVSGTLKRDGREYKFSVDTLQILAEDADFFALKRSALPKREAGPWYELGKKVVIRGEFYEDDPLVKFGESILIQGLQIEKSRLKNVTPENLQKLAVKSAELKLPEAVRLSLVHEALRQEWEQNRVDAESDLTRLRKKISDQLPGAIIPLTTLEGKQFDEYRKEPIGTFNEATKHVQQQLARLLYLAVAQEEFQRKLSRGGANGDLVALDYEKVAPDDPATAEAFREGALMYRSKNIGTARRSEVMDLVRQYREQKQEEMAQTAQKTWLAARRSQLDKAGPSDYLQTATDYDDWLQNRKVASEILLAGIKRYSDNELLQQKLSRWGYVQKEEQWIHQDELPPPEKDEIAEAMQSGRLINGMSREQVASSLGAPKTYSRIASQDETLLVWNYPDAKISVRFARKRNRGEFLVVEISALSTAPVSRQ